MTAEMYYKETYPKELRIQIENEDELDLLRLIFSETPKDILKRYKEKDLAEIGKNNEWKKKVSQKSDMSDIGEAYNTYYVWEALY